ncbi:hypothetical protein, partial [Xanthomonas phaseoli]|uniref:hypothetical protein n=1 Tax=Xanthomonas phaseoli TaxID=1985254 RepID=UPI001ADA3CD6
GRTTMSAQHGARRYHASNEIGDGRLAPLLANAQSGGITRAWSDIHFSPRGHSDMHLPQPRFQFCMARSFLILLLNA